MLVETLKTNNQKKKRLWILLTLFSCLYVASRIISVIAQSHYCYKADHFLLCLFSGNFQGIDPQTSTCLSWARIVYLITAFRKMQSFSPFPVVLISLLKWMKVLESKSSCLVRFCQRATKLHSSGLSWNSLINSAMNCTNLFLFFFLVSVLFFFHWQQYIFGPVEMCGVLESVFLLGPALSEGHQTASFHSSAPLARSTHPSVLSSSFLAMRCNQTRISLSGDASLFRI